MGGTVYLSGGISNLRPGEWECAGWRDHAKEVLEPVGIDCRDPLRGTAGFHNPRAKIKPAEYDAPEISDSALVARDRLDVLQSDVILVHLLGAEKVSIGTICELTLGWDHSKLVVLCMEDKGNVHDHPFPRAMASVRFNDLDQALGYIIDSIAPQAEAA